MSTRVLLSALLTLGAVGVAHAQPPPAAAPANCPQNCPMCAQGGAAMRGGGGWSTGPYAHLYDPKTVETVDGKIVQVDQVAPMRGMSAGVHAVVATDKGPTDVHLGPAWYLDHQDTQLAVGDRVQVRGSRVSVDGKPALIAAEVRKGAETLRLRDAQGLPVWRGWR